jgi:hypothetical protein
MANGEYIIFVDFDGVLTSTRVHFTQQIDSYHVWAQFDPIAIKFFNKIHRAFDVTFVWTTTWRNDVPLDNKHVQHIAYSQWYNAGFEGYFGTPWKVNPNDDLNYQDRAGEVKHYLETYAKDVKDYLIFDDTNYGFNEKLGKKRLILTDPNNGLLYKHMQRAWAIMGEWNRK